MPRIRDPNKGRQAAAVIETKPKEFKAEEPFENEEPKPEGEVEVEASNTDDAVTELQKQLEDLKKSAETDRAAKEQADRDRAEAIRRFQARENEVQSLQKQTVQSELDSVSSGLAAAKAEAESAERDLEAATSNGDTKAQAAAYRRLARAENDIARLEVGKEELEAKAKEPPPRPQQAAAPVQSDPLGLDRSNLPDTAKTWLRAHPEYLTDARKNAKIQSMHWDVVDEGHAPFSAAYYESLEQHLGLRERTNSEPEPPQPQQRRREAPIVSAPVSRQTPTGTSNRGDDRLTLTADQREAAKVSGITEAEYAKQLKRFQKAKEDGLIQ